jgi:hypothetical protein
LSAEDTDAKQLKSTIDRVDGWTAISAENGLFVKNEDDFKKIQESLRESRNALKSPNVDLAKSNECLVFAVKYYSDALSQVSLKWRLLFQYGLDVWVYLVGILATIFFFYYYNIDGLISTTLNIPSLAVDATIWGIVGSILRGIWHLWRNLNDRSYRRSWRMWFLCCPFLGAIFGAIVYLLIVVGLLIVAESEQVDQTEGSLFVMGFCILAGYNWEWAVQRLDKLSESL